MLSMKKNTQLDNIKSNLVIKLLHLISNDNKYKMKKGVNNNI